MRISIVTPSFNQADYIEECIDSIALQGIGGIEHIVIDGGSKDRTVEILEKRASDLTYWVSEPDNGHGHALNKGFKETSGEIMAWINADDKYALGSLRTVRDIFTEFPSVEWIVGRSSSWNSRGAIISSHRNWKNIYDFVGGREKFIQQESVFWRRSLWERSGACISEDYKLMIDGELWSRFFLHAPLVHVSAILGGYRIHGENRGILQREAVFEEMKECVDRLRSLLPENMASQHRAYRLFDQLARMDPTGGLVLHQLARRLWPKFRWTFCPEINWSFDSDCWEPNWSEDLLRVCGYDSSGV